MSDKWSWPEFIIGIIVGGFFTTVILFGVLDVITTNKYYRQGQIDALTGKVHYELVTKDDSTRVWEWKEEK